MIFKSPPAQRIGVITAINSDGSMTVSTGDTVQAYNASDQVRSSAPTAGTACLLTPVGDTYLITSSIGSGAIGIPSLLPNGNFAIPGGGQPPTGWAEGTDQVVQDPTGGPTGGPCAVVTIGTTFAGTETRSLASVIFGVDPGITYNLTFSAQADATIASPLTWPSLNAYNSTTDTFWATNITNGTLSPALSTSWQQYSTVLSVPSDKTAVAVILGLAGNSGSHGSFRFANATLTRTA